MTIQSDGFDKGKIIAPRTIGIRINKNDLNSQNGTGSIGRFHHGSSSGLSLSKRPGRWFKNDGKAKLTERLPLTGKITSQTIDSSRG